MVTDRGLVARSESKAAPLDSLPPLSDSDGVWRAIFESLECGLLVLSEPHQVIVEVNSALCQLWQITRQELLGLRLSDVIAAESESRSRTARGQIQRGPAKGCEVEWRQHPLDGSAPGTWVAIFWQPSPDRPAHASDQDAMTGLPNRRFLEEELARRLAHDRSAFRPFALLFLDLDGFKAVNDRWGHLAGDDLLREAARRLAESVRENDVVARYGGDEFVVLAEGISSARAAAGLARRISTTLARPIAISADNARRRGGEIQLGVSIGLSLAREPGSSPRDLLEKADRDMYRRKRLRRRRANKAIAPPLQN